MFKNSRISTSRMMRVTSCRASHTSWKETIGHGGKKREDSCEIIVDLVQCLIVWIRVNDYLQESFGRFGRDCVWPKDILTMLQVAFLPRQAAEHCEDDEDDKRVNFDALDEDEDGDDNIMMSVSNSSFSLGRRLSGKIHLTSAFNAPM